MREKQLINFTFLKKKKKKIISQYEEDTDMRKYPYLLLVKIQKKGLPKMASLYFIYFLLIIQEQLHLRRVQLHSYLG